jgi:Cys-tRNA(Pro) deacylase
MSVEDVRRFFREKGVERPILEFEKSSATVELAAKALGVEPALIAKTLAFRAGERPLIVVARGDARIDNRKFKDTFRAKPKMIPADEVEELTGHAVGGVCPFGLRTEVDVYLDLSLRDFETVFPAAGAGNNAVEMTPEELLEVTGASWVDVCRDAG